MLIEKFKVSSHHCDADGKIKLSALQHFMQDCACTDVDFYGTTTDEMRKNSMAFVLTRISFDFYGDIYEGDTAEVLTVHSAIEGVTLIREFAVSNGKGLCCRATTVWVIINLETRRILRPGAVENFPPPVVLFDRRVESEKKLFSKDDITLPLGEIIISNRHIDENGHVNNTYYQDFIGVALADRFADKHISHMQINYVHEALSGDKLCLHGIFADDAKIRAMNGEQCCFEALVKFTENK